MKVSELIKELQKIDPDLEVHNHFEDFYYDDINDVEVVNVDGKKFCILF